jgi:RNA polymerase sigma-B factor
VFDPVSLDEPSPGEESLPLSERIGDFDSDLQSADEQALLRAALARLTPRQRRVLQYAYFENRSQIEIAGILNVSQMHVSRLLRVALGQLKKHLESDR